MIGLVQFVPLFALTLRHRLGRRPARPARSSPARRSRSNCSARPSLGWLAWTGADHPARLVRASPALLGVARAFADAGAAGARAQSGAARDPAARDRDELDRLADRARSPARRSAAISTPGPRTCPMRSPAGLFAIVALLHVHDRPEAAHARSRARPIPGAQMVDGLRYVRQQQARARRDLARSVRGPARRRDRDAAGLRARHTPCRRDRRSAICAPRRRSARP